jgi:hypothetical protein
MGLPWVRLDTQFASNPKVLELVADRKFKAAFAYVCSLGYSGVHGTDGFLPANCLPFIHASRPDAHSLVEVGLWLLAPGGWEINGWLDFQESSEETQKRKERAQKGAIARWEKEKKKREAEERVRRVPRALA